MLADTVFEIIFPDFITHSTNTGSIRKVMKCAIKLRQIAYLLSPAPLPARITCYGKYIVPT